MKSAPAVVAVDPMILDQKIFNDFIDKIQSLKQNGDIGETTLVSVMHYGQFLEPFSWYSQTKFDHEREMHRKVTASVNSRLGDSAVVILQSLSSHPEDVAEVLSEYAKSQGADTLIFLNQEHGFWTKVILGSVTKAAAKLKQVPLLIVGANELQSKRPPLLQPRAPPSIRA